MVAKLYVLIITVRTENVKSLSTVDKFNASFLEQLSCSVARI